LGIKAPKWYTLFPALFMLVVTETALIYQLVFSYIPKFDIVLIIITTLLIILGIWVAIEALTKIFKVKAEEPQMIEPTPVENAK
jgi:carbon starvation protein CstA